MNGVGVEPLPEGTRLVHIGPHKTGTTFLQAAFHAARREVEAQGVHYASHNRQAVTAARAVTGRGSAYDQGRVPAGTHWRRIVSEAERGGARRTLLSAEVFADADTKAIRRVIRDLDPQRVHVVATLRQLLRILPSQWQQYVQNGNPQRYPDWLEEVFDRPADRTAARFWHRHRHDALVRRWAEVAGAGRTTVVVLDERDQEGVLRAFEGLLGLRAGTLVPAEGRGNRSLTQPEVDLVQALHRAYEQWLPDRGLRLNLLFHGAAANLKLHDPEPGAPRIRTPDWAIERATEVSREIVDGIRASGVRVIGNLDLLVGDDSERAVATTREERPREAAWPAIVATAAMGVVIQTGMTRGARFDRADASRWPDGAAVTPERRDGSPALDHWSTKRLSSLVSRRVRWAARVRFRPIVSVLRRAARRRPARAGREA